MAVATTSSNAQKGFLPSESMACEQWRWASSACGSPAEKRQIAVTPTGSNSWCPTKAVKDSFKALGWQLRLMVQKSGKLTSWGWQSIPLSLFLQGFINIPVGDRHIFPELSTICSLCASYLPWWTYDEPFTGLSILPFWMAAIIPFWLSSVIIFPNKTRSQKESNPI